ncbi:hypothetical protein O181_004382 [Austropuccinia psidii MF-1]|uniref:Uncharacterized protein n=1 Tax=Austropuccinia psidii MF-1 TaxID=1389203 RepID=A0A9Q3GFQ9_9BASI|nr:hypothetical protein [Austropuccinia psidii MF-1]
MSPVHLRNLDPKEPPRGQRMLLQSQKTWKRKLGHSGGWQDTEGNHTHSSIHLLIQQKPQNSGLEGYESSSSPPTTPQISFPMESGKKEVPPSITLGRNWSKTPGGELNQDKGESSHYPSYRRTAEPDRAYSDSFRLTRSRPTQLSSNFTPFRHQQISGQESPFSTIPGSFQQKTRIPGKKQDIFQTKAERVRPNDPEAVGLGEGSMQVPEIVLNTSRVTSPNNENITPTQNEHSVFTPESHLNSNALWLQMSQFSE